MKCRKCGDKAVLQMRQHKLALCRDHFLEWLPTQTRRAIETYEMVTPGDRILVAVSGGKDSLALWDVLLRLGYQADGLYIDLGIEAGSYSLESRRCAETFAASHAAHLQIYEAEAELGASIPQAARLTRRGRDKPCSVCGLSKRHIMNRAALEGGYDVLVTGHNLDDEAATLFGNTLNWQVGYLQRQSPVLAGRPGLVRKAKPFCRIYERETAAYTFLRGIEYIYDECPYAAGAKSLYYKEVLNRMERERPGAKLSFYLGFLRSKQSMTFVDEKVEYLFNACPECGGLTTSDGSCSFCRMKGRVQERVQTTERKA